MPIKSLYLSIHEKTFKIWLIIRKDCVKTSSYWVENTLNKTDKTLYANCNIVSANFAFVFFEKYDGFK